MSDSNSTFFGVSAEQIKLKPPTNYKNNTGFAGNVGYIKENDPSEKLNLLHFNLALVAAPTGIMTFTEKEEPKYSMYLILHPENHAQFMEDLKALMKVVIKKINPDIIPNKTDRNEFVSGKWHNPLAINGDTGEISIATKVAPFTTFWNGTDPDLPVSKLTVDASCFPLGKKVYLPGSIVTVDLTMGYYYALKKVGISLNLSSVKFIEVGVDQPPELTEEEKKYLELKRMRTEQAQQ